jgi:hypothetical protein
MKSRVMRLVVITFALLVCGTTTLLADGGEPSPFPLCYPKACQVK